jgi:hypothetical protein
MTCEPLEDINVALTIVCHMMVYALENLTVDALQCLLVVGQDSI